MQHCTLPPTLAADRHVTAQPSACGSHGRTTIFRDSALCDLTGGFGRGIIVEDRQSQAKSYARLGALDLGVRVLNANLNQDGGMRNS